MRSTCDARFVAVRRAWRAAVVVGGVLVSGCVVPVAARPGAGPARSIVLGALAEEGGDEGPGEPTIETRTYPGSPTVDVVGYSDGETAYGLRTFIRRDGTPSPEHRVYVSTFARGIGARYYRASIPAGPVQLLGVTHDAASCSGGHRACTPYATFGARVTDSDLRASRAGVDVTFFARDGQTLALTLPPELVEAYLGKVDSVVAALRHK